MALSDNPTEAELFDAICEHAQVLDYLLQYRVSRQPAPGQTSTYLLRVAKRHVREAVSFARTGLGIPQAPEESEQMARNPEYILARVGARAETARADRIDSA